MTDIYQDRRRQAILWLLDGNTVVIPEEYWPPAAHGDNDKAAKTWHELTGLTVTITCETKTTAHTKVEKKPDWYDDKG